MDKEVRLAHGILSGELVVDYGDERVDDICRALIEAHEKIATRDAMIKSQSECIERLRKAIEAYEREYGEIAQIAIRSAFLEHGDMGEPT